VLVVVLQFCAKDWLRAAKLAHLLADVERRRRDDVCVLFVRASDFQENPVMDAAVARCAEVFLTNHLLVRPDKPSRADQWHNLGNWVEGSNILWTAAVEHVLQMSPRWQTVFFADGGDGVPLHRDWVDVMQEDHAATVRAGLHVTGALRQCRGVMHVNGNQVVERSFLAAHPEFTEIPTICQEWDVHHAAAILPVARVSSLIYGGWHQFGANPRQLAEIALHSAWWHGCKDGDFVDLARACVLGVERRRPELVDLGRASELQSSRFSS
jgi:hypothetical protein